VGLGGWAALIFNNKLYNLKLSENDLKSLLFISNPKNKEFDR
jgi:hypothetical protein